MKHSEETKQKIREIRLAQNAALGEEGRKAKYGRQNIGKKLTKEQREAKSKRMREDYASGKRKSAIKGKSIKSFMTGETFLQRNRKISETRKRKFETGKLTQVHKGKTYDELFTPEKAAELKQIISLSKSGDKAPMRNLESRNKMIQSIRKGWENGRKLPINNNPQGGFRNDLGHYVRSRWEANICRLLLFLNKEYQYESKSFIIIDKNSIKHSYTPDIRITNTNIFIEIKGRQIGIKKHELFRKQYPEYFLGFINLYKYNIFKRKYKDIVYNWE